MGNLDIRIRDINQKSMHFLVYPDNNSNRQYAPFFEKLQDYTLIGCCDILQKMNTAYISEEQIPNAVIVANKLGMHTVFVFYIGTTLTGNLEGLFENALAFKNKNKEFIVAGDINDISFKKSFLMINVDNYILQGCPKLFEQRSKFTNNFEQLPEEVFCHLNTLHWEANLDTPEVCYEHAVDPRPFILNTENYISNIGKWDIDFIGSQIITPAPGFKFINILDFFNFKYTDDCKIIFFDHNKQTLEVKQHIMQGWDGVSYLKTFLEKQYKELIDEYWSEDDWKRDQKVFGAKFHHFFSIAKQWNNEFHYIDIIHDLDAFIKIIPDKPGTIVHVSNIFDYELNWAIGTLTVFEQWIKLVRHLQSYDNEVLLIGNDPLHNPLLEFAKNIHTIKEHRMHSWEA